MQNKVDLVNQVDDTAEQIFESIHTLMHQYRALQFAAIRADELGLTHMEGKVLGYFSRHPGASQSDLALHSGRDKAQLTRLIARLKEAGLLQAHADTRDRRTVRLTLTADGQALHSTLRQQGRQLAAKAMDGIAAQQRSELLRLLQQIKTNLEQPD
ncbi:MarR family winged helix-turn-helix transcriptional regulator [Aquitalea aquatica]|uniref:MarR family transcriptional regulator n=1 Tax=Aquitalea aquatica TaxID=3044273 RepID=A0A838Y136_9NEIS|nr:MarR family transcriptional regulator [Aquitalea magnusonii]MBA4706972.1 MarR family transcriptional regulator [Aquitalea magnusonii]